MSGEEEEERITRLFSLHFLSLSFLLISSGDFFSEDGGGTRHISSIIFLRRPISSLRFTFSRLRPHSGGLLLHSRPPEVCSPLPSRPSGRRLG
jgi:hypothetical protein